MPPTDSVSSTSGLCVLTTTCSDGMLRKRLMMMDVMGSCMAACLNMPSGRAHAGAPPAYCILRLHDCQTQHGPRPQPKTMIGCLGVAGRVLRVDVNPHSHARVVDIRHPAAHPLHPHRTGRQPRTPRAPDEQRNRAGHPPRVTRDSLSQRAGGSFPRASQAEHGAYATRRASETRAEPCSPRHRRSCGPLLLSGARQGRRRVGGRKMEAAVHAIGIGPARCGGQARRRLRPSESSRRLPNLREVTTRSGRPRTRRTYIGSP